MYITPAADLSAPERPGNGRQEREAVEFSDLFACLMVLTGEAEDRCDPVSLDSAQSAGWLPEDEGLESGSAGAADPLQISPPLPTPDLATGPLPAATEGACQEEGAGKQGGGTSFVTAGGDNTDPPARKEAVVFAAPRAAHQENAERALSTLAAAERLPANASSAEVAPCMTPASVSDIPAAATALRPAVASALLAGAAGSAEWQHSLSQQIGYFIREGVHHAELRLQPASLGPIQVSLRVSNEQVEVSFIAPHPQTREALDGALPLLRQSLSASGMALGESQISGDKSDSSHLFYGREKEPQHPEKRGDMPENIERESQHRGSEYGLSYRGVNIFV